MSKFKTISADSHIVEPGDLWLKYIDAAFRERAPRLVRLADRDVLDFPGLHATSFGLNAGAGRKPEEVRRAGRFDTDVPRAAWDPRARLEAISIDGVEAEVLYPTACLRIYAYQDSAFLYACLDAYNRWLADFCTFDPVRYKGIGMISLDDTGQAIKQLKTVGELGLAGAMVPLRPDTEHPYSGDYYDSFWAAAQELQLPITLHIATQRSDAEALATSFPDWVTKTVYIQRSLAELIFSGVFERFPHLKVVSAENDIGWIGNFLERMDHRFTNSKRLYTYGIPDHRLPSEYFHRNVYATFMQDISGILLREVIGIDNIMWASDYPHHESTWPHSQEILAAHFRNVPEEHRRKIVAENAAKLYHFN